MKKIYFLLIGFCFFESIHAQIVDIPDANFKAKLLSASSTNQIAKDLSGSFFKIDANNDGEIQISEAQNVKLFYINSSDISSLIGVSNFSNLTYLDCSSNQLTSLDLTGLVKLTRLECGNNKLSSLDVAPLVNLTILNCGKNQITTLEVNPLVNLTWLTCSSNQLSSLDVRKLVNLVSLDCSQNPLRTIDVTTLKNLNFLTCTSNQLTSLDVASLVNLKDLNCSRNQLTSLNVSSLVNLLNLYCPENQISSLNVTSLINLKSLACSYNKLTSLDLSNQKKLESLYCGFNDLKSLFIKNTNLGPNSLGIFNFGIPDSIEYICVNEKQLVPVQNFIDKYGYKCHINTYCSFVPEGIYYTIKGKSKLDSNKNGCDGSDLFFPNLNFSITDGTSIGDFISNSTGNYFIPVQAGTYAITPTLENLNYYNVSPASINVTFPAQTSPFTQDFCITPNGVHQDVEVTIIPIIPARPGFDITYKIIYKNKGTVTKSGSVKLTFDDTVLDLVTANPVFTSQSIDNLSWDYLDLKPFETREITVVLNVNSPMETPAVNVNDRLSFTALISPVTADEKPVDNSFALRQQVVGSFDPNDKTCLEGDIITPDLIGEYVHYLIRFENTGNYAAENIVVKDMIDLSKFDISTLVPTKASHEFVTKISEGNKVEFIFENINLPFDNATNDGYLAFKIKTLPTLKVGDTFTNEANIYFDYNFPILTNKAATTIQTLGTSDFEFSTYFNVFPNPTTEVLNISLKKTIAIQSLAIYDVLGQIVIAVPDAKSISKIDVSTLKTGTYFIKMNTDKGIANAKFMKN